MELQAYFRDLLGDDYDPSKKHVLTKPSGFQRRLRQGFLPMEKLKDTVMFNGETFIAMVKEGADAQPTPSK